jgi:hypothetical protein
MATTTQRAIYAGILSDLHTAADADEIGVHKDFIYITPVPIFTQADDRIIQLIPSVPTVETDSVGLGLVEEEFRVCVWVRNYLDQAMRSTIRLTDATLGALVTVGEVRQTLIQSTANGTSTVPVRWLFGSAPIESEEEAGWMYYEDTYVVGYEIVWS